MRAIPIRVLAPLALSLAAPFAVSAGAQDTQERSRSNQVQDARGAQGGARGNQTPEQRKAAQEKAAREKAAREKAAQEKAAQEKAQQRKQQQAREAAEKERQAGGQPEARPPQRREADPASEQEKLEQRKQNARQQQQQQQQDEQRQLEQRKQNARAQQQQQGAGGGAGSKGRGALPAAQRDAVNQWAAEMRLHRERVARIERLKEIAASGKQRERVTELDQLLTRETKRHEGKLARIEGALDPAVLRQLQARSAKVGGADPQRREGPPAKDTRGGPAEGARKAPADGARKAPADGARKEATGGALNDAAGTKGDKGSTRPR